jgi:F0F1-type ATP synthase membrane subunit b/b'
MATTDDPVDNIRRFIATLTAANGALETIGRHVQETAGDLAQLDQDAHDQGGGLNAELEELRSKLDAEAQDARNSIEELAHLATDGQRTLAESEGHLEEAAAQIEQQARTACADLDHENTELVDQGFTLLGHSIDAAEQQLQTAGQESEQAFKELEGAVHGYETEAQVAWDAGDAALAHAGSDAPHQESELTTEAFGAAQGFESAGSELSQACHALEGEIGAIYDGFATGVDAACQELTQALGNLLQAAVGFVEAVTHTQLEEPADALEHGALAPLGEEYRQLHAALESATAVTTELEPLVDELTKCQVVVDKIDQALNAMTEGA